MYICYSKKMEALFLKILVFITLFLCSASQNCKDRTAEDCIEDKMKNYDEDYNYYLKQIQDALNAYKPCTSANCSCYINVLKKDFEPFKKGINRKSIEEVSHRGIVYQIVENKIYRQKDCNFPARCSGVEHFIKKVLKKVKLKNMELVINVRDYPQIVTQQHGSVPGIVLSFSKTDDYSDILFPAWSFYEGGPAISLYPTGIGRWDLLRNTVKDAAEKWPWERKIEKAFFRGSRTSEERDSLIMLSRKHPEIVDAQYTKNQAWKSPKDTLGYEPAKEISLEEHCQYKYLFNFRGVAASFRFKFLFLCKSLVFHVGDELKEFFYDSLKPWVHYIPISSKASPEQLKKIIEFFNVHQELSQQIADRGHEMIWNNLKIEDVECYWRRLLRHYAKLTNYDIEQRDNNFILIN